MPPSSSLSQRGQFRQMYMGLKAQRLLSKTPVILCEGDSWFSTPLYMNMLDWIDGFVERVLEPVKHDASLGGMFDYVDLRGHLTDPAQWNDEMHPTDIGFHTLASIFRGKLIGKLPAAKR